MCISENLYEHVCVFRMHQTTYTYSYWSYYSLHMDLAYGYSDLLQ